MGRIEHTLLDEGSASSPTDLRPSPAIPPYHKSDRCFYLRQRAGARKPGPGEGRRLQRDWFGRLQVSDVRGGVNTPAVSLQQPAEVRKVQELHAENAARPVGVEIYAGLKLH